MTELEIEEIQRWLISHGFLVIRRQGNELTIRLPE